MTKPYIQVVQEHEEATAALRAENKRLRELLELPLLFHSGGVPNVARWTRIVGTPEMTTKVMCDTIRAVLEGAAG